ncbi:MAG TPA: V-type ATP synthase subunit E family protein [Candidatus Lokiarchaeia archaeon]|nr:V-type ATP synthase subunit E family protein [Candidatus Lokiarchaeia archaeon]
MSFNLAPASIEVLRRHVLEDAKKEAEIISKDGQDNVENIKIETDKTRDYIENIQIKNKSNTLEEDLKDNAGSLEKMRARKLLQFKQDSLHQVIDEAVTKFKNQLRENPEYYYSTYLRNLIQVALDSTVFKEYYLIVNQQDKEYIQDHPEYLETFNKPITLRDETFEDDVGCIFQDKDFTIQFDNRLSKKVETRLSFLKTKISQVLFKRA